MASTVDATGTRICEARIDENAPAAFAAYFKALAEESKVVIEACWNWGWLYDLLREVDGIKDVVLAHPFKTRLIADAQGAKRVTGCQKGRGAKRVRLCLLL